jgi:hypothetical protein
MGQHNQGVFRGDQKRAAKAAWAAMYPEPVRKPRKHKGAKPGQFTDWRELESWLAR